MKLRIEQWLDQYSFSADVNELFIESIKCYKASAYRSSFLMSYLGFLQIVKERILEGNKPNDIGVKEWEDRSKKLRDDDKWETEVNEMLIKKNGENRNRFFLISESLMDDINFFRQRRNDCAHAKSTIIDNSHVEVLWSFLKSNLDKIVLNGGKQSLLLEIERHFDYSYTNPNESAEHLVSKISGSVENGEIQGFLEELIKIVDFTESKFFEKHEGDSHKKISFWKSMIQLDDENLTNNITKFISEDENLFLVFVVQNPSYLDYFKGYSTSIRRLWKKNVFRELESFEFDSWPLISHILINDLIENEDEQKVFVERVVGCLRPHNYPSEQYMAILNSYGFKQPLKEKVLSILDGNYSTVNNKGELVVFFLKNYGLDESVYKHLDSLYSKYSFGSFNDRLRAVISENTIVKQSFIEYKKANEQEVVKSNIFDLFPDI
ncbi:hypothetical protein [Exiguobacterium sp. CinTr1]|uniref:hypothetical protein n=1 Tax=Exiguobacterium sp. CinTr1 TaxID=2995315 RepID=UPI0022E56C4D|nr:hypothetical protein [Exiguobacterium sp. CinTr1]